MTQSSLIECEKFLGTKARWNLMQKQFKSDLSLAFAIQHPDLSDEISITIREISFR